MRLGLVAEEAVEEAFAGFHAEEVAEGEGGEDAGRGGGYVEEDVTEQVAAMGYAHEVSCALAQGWLFAGAKAG